MSTGQGQTPWGPQGGPPPPHPPHGPGGPEPDRSQRRKNLLVALIGSPVLAALIAGAFQLLPDSDDSGSHAAAVSGSGAGRTGGQAASTDRNASTAASAPSAPAAPPVVQPLWHGTVLLSSKGIDFSAIPPRLGDTNDLSVDVLNLYENTLDGSVFTGSTVARWTESEDPQPADCTALLATHGVSHTPLDLHDRFCIKSGSGRTVFVKVVDKPDEEHWELEAKVWPASAG